MGAVRILHHHNCVLHVAAQKVNIEVGEFFPLNPAEPNMVPYRPGQFG